MPALARDHGISKATDYRQLDEVITVLAAQAADFHDVLRKAERGRTVAGVDPLSECPVRR